MSVKSIAQEHSTQQASYVRRPTVWSYYLRTSSYQLLYLRGPERFVFGELRSKG